MSIPLIAKITFTNWQRLLLYSLLSLAIFVFTDQSVNAQPAAPKFQTFDPISPIHSSKIIPTQFPGQTNSILSNDPYAAQNRRILQQAGMAPGPTMNKQQIPDEARRDLRQGAREETDVSTVWLRSFQKNLMEYLPLNPDSFSITRAVYLSESAYYENPPSFREFELSIKQGAGIVKQILRKENLDENANLSLNYAIQKLYTQENEYYDSSTGRKYIVNKLHYDHDDFLGERDWTKMFVTKLLHTGTGQCHSLPLFYLCIAEQLHAKAYLSLSPNHSFIQYLDKEGNRYNFETTNGRLVSQTWLAGSNFITASALKNRTYLDTLSSRKLYAQCLGDLLLSYLSKLGHYDNFSAAIMQRILNVDSTNIIALMEQANLYNLIYLSELKVAGNPSEKTYARYPRLSNAYSQYEMSRQKIEQTGFQEMPKEEYQAWLKSLDNDKQKQLDQDEQKKMESEIKRLKHLRSKLINTPKG